MSEMVGNVIRFQRRDAVRARAAGGGGGMSSGGGGNEIDKRLTRLEASFENVSVMLTDIRSDIRLLLGGGVGGGILLFGAIVSSHLMLQEDINTLRAKDDAIIERLSRLETSVAVLLARNEDREVMRLGTPNAARDAANSSAGPEVLH